MDEKELKKKSAFWLTVFYAKHYWWITAWLVLSIIILLFYLLHGNLTALGAVFWYVVVFPMLGYEAVKWVCRKCIDSDYEKERIKRKKEVLFQEAVNYAMKKITKNM